MSLHKARISQYEEVLSQDIIDVQKLKELALNGIPEDNGLRSMVWKILLNYLPNDKSLQKEALEKNRQLYKQFINEIIVAPGDGLTDHPLNMSPTSTWSTYFKDNDVLLQIDKDVRRLCPEISFFQTPTEFPCPEIVNSNGVKRLHTRVQQTMLDYSTLERKGLGVSKAMLLKHCISVPNQPKQRLTVGMIARRGCAATYRDLMIALRNDNRRTDKVSGDYVPLKEGSEAHWEVVERMLFLYAKLNPGQGYVQGMNEIIGPIYHTFASDRNIEYTQHAEADCFFCFTNLMAEIRDFFIRSLDETESGINSMMRKLNRRLRENDPIVWHLLEKQELRPQYYSFRWLTLLLSQEFSLPDVERIWDTLFADPKRFDTLINVCCAMIILVRTNLLQGDFASNVKLLQRFPPMDVSLILQKAIEIGKPKLQIPTLL